MSTLYPLKFKPIYKEKIWGGNKLKKVFGREYKAQNAGESWELSCVQGAISKVANGFLKGNNIQELIEIYMGELIGDKVYEKFGLEFPLLIKFIDANEDLSIQVHPDDDLSVKRHHAYGKTEMWYIIQAENDAKIVSGFNKKINKEFFLKALEDKTIKSILNYEPTLTGDVFFLPAGRIHAIGSGIFLAEIQQTSDVTYRLYDYDRLDEKGKLRELHIDLAMDALDFNLYSSYKTSYKPEINKSCRLVQCPYFTTNMLHINNRIIKDYFKLDSFVIYICIDGVCEIGCSSLQKELIKAGETILIPAIHNEVSLMPLPETKILEVYIE